MDKLAIPVEAWPIRFHPNGDPKVVVPARVTSVGMTPSNGSLPQVTLNFEMMGGGELGHAKAVRHIDDPRVLERPDLAQRDGTWSYLPGLVPECEEEVRDEKPKKPAKKPIRSEKESQIKERGLELARKMAADGKTLEEIAKSCGSYGLTHAEIEEAMTQPVG